MAISEKAKEKEIMTVRRENGYSSSWSLDCSLMQLRTDVPITKKAKTNYELEEEEATKDMKSFETNFV